MEDIRDARPDIHLYYNPLINIVLDKLEYSTKCVFDFDKKCFKVWYPLDKEIENLQSVNDGLRSHGLELIHN